MRNIKQVFNEEDVTKLIAGDWVKIKGQEAMRRNKRGDGVEYLIPNEDRTVTIINLRGYNLSKGEIIPVNYSEKIINLDKKYLENKK